MNIVSGMGDRYFDISVGVWYEFDGERWVSMELDPSDILVKVIRNGVFPNNECAVIIAHLPTGIIVSCADFRSELKNKNQALRELRSLLENCPDDY